MPSPDAVHIYKQAHILMHNLLLDQDLRMPLQGIEPTGTASATAGPIILQQEISARRVWADLWKPTTISLCCYARKSAHKIQCKR
jgi:hypothetical protein